MPAFDDVVLPTAAEEIWRYSRIADLDLRRYQPGRATTTVTGDADASSARSQRRPRSWTPPYPDVFAELNATHAQTLRISVPQGHTATEPIVVTHAVDGAGTAAFPRLVIDAADDSEVTVVERFTSPAGADVLVVPVLQVHAGPAARVRYLGVNELADTAWQIGHQQAIGDRDSTTTLATVALGGHYARVRTEARTGRRRRQHPPGRPLLRRRPADARLPHDPGPRRPPHDQRPAVQGRGAGRVAQRLHRPDQGPQARPRHGGVPDQPQPHAQRGGVGGERARTSRSRPTTCAAATPRRSGRSTPTSASTSRAGASRPRSPSG